LKGKKTNKQEVRKRAFPGWWDHSPGEFTETGEWWSVLFLTDQNRSCCDVKWPEHLLVYFFSL